MTRSKSVAIIGSGPSLLQEKYGTFIDSHDVIIRINLNSSKDREMFFGSRTDVRYIGANLTSESSALLSSILDDEVLFSTAKNKGKDECFSNGFLHSRIAPVWVIEELGRYGKNKGWEGVGNKPPRSGVVFLAFVLASGQTARISLFGFSKNSQDGAGVLDYRNGTYRQYDLCGLERDHCPLEREAEALSMLEELGFVTVY